MMWMVFGAIGGSIVIFGLGAGGFYWFYIKTRQKKVTYNARIWEITGELNPFRNKDGLIVDNIPLKMLKPYDTDIIEKVDLEYHNTIFRLVKHNRPVPEVKAEHITFWGDKAKIVNVLKDGDNFTLLRQGCRKFETGDSEMVFQPLDYDLSNMLLNQYSLKQDRRKKEKDVLQAITPWIVVGICMMAIVMSSYFLAQGWVQSVEGQKEMATMNAESSKLISANLVQIAQVVKGGGVSSGNVTILKEQGLGLQESKPPVNATG